MSEWHGLKELFESRSVLPAGVVSLLRSCLAGFNGFSSKNVECLFGRRFLLISAIFASTSTSLMLFLLLCSHLTACATPETAQAPQQGASLRITSSVLTLEWTEQAEGWALSQLTTGGRPLGDPQ